MTMICAPPVSNLLQHKRVCTCSFAEYIELFVISGQIAEEARRCLSLPEEKDTESFIAKCIKNLKEKLDPVIYYGISNGALGPPPNATEGKEFIKARYQP